MSGPHRDRWNPASPKANPHWMRLYAAKRRALDRQVLADAERAISADETGQRPTAASVNAIPALDVDARAAIARAFGRPLDPSDH